MGLLRFFRVKRKSKVADKKTILDAQIQHSFFATRFRWTDIETFTKNFSTLVGSGGFSTVYLARTAPGMAAAVKILGASERLNRMFRQELDILLQLRHRNIVNFVGYCDERDEGALVFEYVPNGNLQEKLHRRPASTVLPWKIRLVIAFQLAQAIEYLHEKCSLQIVHGDIKSSNILLDEQFNCKLCDFGSAKMGFSSAVGNPSSSSSSPSSPFRAKQLMMGSPGYTDPQYLRTGIASKKNDVYSFGVVLLELVTGKEAFCSEKGQILTSILPPTVRDGGGIKPSEVAELVDPKLRGDFNGDEAGALITIAAACVRQPPAPRPTIGGVVEMIREKMGNVGEVKRGSKLLDVGRW
ncbi:putative receptor-like protein kinase [Cucumis melo var. makuwa]|uniref:Receptor-like protein kinase n=1 Tax=Cucumis melo var. makuwa TaxID=1194695 RepID=A0A5A7TIL0_CUCMM|nr:putative receptor-like protein kinase [Cucumis melo var. makuwa]TYK06020.1 putative receptor-like protein kinase [Cucumis melo var. makuwa]